MVLGSMVKGQFTFKRSTLYKQLAALTTGMTRSFNTCLLNSHCRDNPKRTPHPSSIQVKSLTHLPKGNTRVVKGDTAYTDKQGKRGNPIPWHIGAAFVAHVSTPSSQILTEHYAINCVASPSLSFATANGSQGLLCLGECQVLQPLQQLAKA